MHNLLYTNHNPGNTICSECVRHIGCVYEPGTEPELPMHVGCYCTYYPTELPPGCYSKRELATHQIFLHAHNSETADSEPAWSDVDKTRLPRAAFARQEGSKSDWGYPHHWIQAGSKLDDDGCYTDGTMYLHRGGLDAAWAAAQGARSGEKAEGSVVDHLQAHRRALGLDEENTSLKEQPMTESTTENSPSQVSTGQVLLQPQTLPTGGGDLGGARREYDCIFITPGQVKQADQEPSSWLIPAEVLQEAANQFNARPVYLDHPDEGFWSYGDPKVKNLVGITFGAGWDEEGQAITGKIRLYDQDPNSPGAFVGLLFDQILADKAAGLEVPPTGLSAVFFQASRLDQESGLRVTTNVKYVESVDIVYDPGAGGYIRQALGAARNQVFSEKPGFSTTTGANSMPEEVQTQTQPPAREEPPPEPVHVGAHDEQLEQDSPQYQQLASRLDQLAASVQQLTNTLAREEEAQTITGMGQPRISMGRTSLEQVEAAYEAMLAGVNPPSGVRPLTGIRELYHLLSGDYEMTGMFQGERVYLANVTSSTMANLTADLLNKRVVNMFQNYPRWWTPIVLEDDFANLQDVKWITLGGVGELPTVAEGAAYTELTWDDQRETEAFVKKGGYLGLTLEAIDKDDTARLRSAPRALAQGAWLTLGKSVSNIFTANSGVGPTLDTDSTALFHSNHSNLGTSALSWSSWVATRTAMRKQTELNSSERLGALTAPRYCLAPPDLEITALQVFASEGEPGTADNDENPFAQGNQHEARMREARRRVIVVDLWTDTNNWAAVADPLLYPCIGIGYRYGRTPEIFSVASPTAGLMFTNDTMPVKVRFFYACGVIDYRGLYKHNV